MPAGTALAIDVEARDVVPDDETWARENLRFRDGRPLLDIANCLRVIERHPDFNARFRFNEVLVKVLDRGTVMIDWRLSEFVAILQEWFLPEVPFEIASRALVVAANKASQK